MSEQSRRAAEAAQSVIDAFVGEGRYLNCYLHGSDTGLSVELGDRESVRNVTLELLTRLSIAIGTRHISMDLERGMGDEPDTVSISVRFADLVPVHTDGGDCHGTPLIDNRCPGCGIAPDMQSIELWPREKAKDQSP